MPTSYSFYCKEIGRIVTVTLSRDFDGAVAVSDDMGGSYVGPAAETSAVHE